MELDKDFRALMPKLKSDEYQKLEQSIIEEGCRDALIVWNDILLDGYNRYEICRKHDVEFKTTQKEFDNREEAVNWIIDNQLGRRNLTVEQKNYLIGKKYKREKQSHGGDRKSSSKTELEGKVSEQLSKEHKVSVGAVVNAEKFADAVDLIAANVDSKARNEILSRNIDATAKDVKKLSEQDADTQKKAIEKARGGKKLKNAIKGVKKENQEKERKELAEEGSKIPLSDKVKLIHGDFREKSDELKDESIDLILTDPPYGKEYLDIWEKLSEFASRKLKPGGFLITYSGQTYLPKVLRHLNAHLEYYWVFALYHSGSNQLINHRDIFCGWKPVLIYYKLPKRRFKIAIEDVIQGGGREKKLHKWQQGQDELKSLIEHFSLPKDTICDPCAGSGTVLSAGLKLNRFVIGIDIDKSSLNIIRNRLKEV